MVAFWGKEVDIVACTKGI